MKTYQKKVSVGAFLKKGVDIKDGDIIEIANEGAEQPGEYGIQNIFLVKIAGGREGNLSINQTSLNGIIDAYGEQAANWIDKKIKATKIKQNVGGKFLDVWYFSHPDAELTENGFVLPGKISGELKDNSIPVVEDDEEFEKEALANL